MAIKGLNIASIPNPTGGAAYANVFAKIDPAEVYEGETGNVNVNCFIKYYDSVQAYTDKKTPIQIGDKFNRVILTYTPAEWAALDQSSAYNKLKTFMETPTPVPPSNIGGFGWTGVTTILV